MWSRSKGIASWNRAPLTLRSWNTAVLIEDFLCENTSRCIKTAINLAGNGPIKSSHLLSGIVKNYESLASRTLWLLGVPDEIDQVGFGEDGENCQFSEQVKAILQRSVSLVEDGTPLEIRKYAWSLGAVWPAHIVVSMLRSECEANRILSSLTISEESFLDGLALLYTTFLGTEFGASEVQKRVPWGAARLEPLRASVSCNTQLLLTTVSFDDISTLQRDALRLYLESIIALMNYFDDQLESTTLSLAGHPTSQVRPKHDPRNYLVNVISQLWELEDYFTQIPERARVLTGSARYAAIRLHDHFTLAKTGKIGP